MNKKNSTFWAQAKVDYEEVLTWPKWKRCIVISAYTTETGQFIGKDIKENNESF